MYTGFVHGVIAGHGGVDENGVYQIIKEGSKQAKVGDKMIYEGQENRFIRDEIMVQSPMLYVDTIDIVPEIADLPLSERVQRINAAKSLWAKQGKRLLIWELHLNAFNGEVQGTEVYTTRKNNFSDRMADIWWSQAKNRVVPFIERTDKSDGDVDKEKDFTVIKGSNAYAILMEFFFFDHADSVARWCNPEGYHIWARTVVDAMNYINTNIDPVTLDLIHNF